MKILPEMIKEYAPTLAAIISSSSPIAGLVINMLANAFDADAKDEEALIVASLAQKDLLRKLEFEHRARMTEVLMQKVIEQETSMPYLFQCILVASFLTIAVILIFWQVFFAYEN
jgi:hypothetical protein